MTDPTNKVVFPRTAHQKPKQALKPQIINYKIIIQLVGRGLGWRRFHRNRLKKYKILLKAVKEDLKDLQRIYRALACQIFLTPADIRTYLR